MAWPFIHDRRQSSNGHSVSDGLLKRQELFDKERFPRLANCLRGCPTDIYPGNQPSSDPCPLLALPEDRPVLYLLLCAVTAARRDEGRGKVAASKPAGRAAVGQVRLPKEPDRLALRIG